jgi:DNA-binding XRE family transcriptional regulator
LLTRPPGALRLALALARFFETTVEAMFDAGD